MHTHSSDSEQYDSYQTRLTPNPNPALALAQHPQIDVLCSTLRESLPFCCGTLDLPKDNFVLYYGKDERVGRIDLLTASSTALDALEAACDPATFGVNQQDVLDVSYRKAGKLDKAHFSANIDVARAGFLDIVRTGLFTGKDEGKNISAEIYKLNVYGKDSFFKAHKDTPRGATMFGSLVLVFPTRHEGGTLVLRHENHEWTVDAAQMLDALPRSSPRVAYVAFFSDVEHEVKRVTSGHRITITYNLYFTADADHALDLTGLNVVEPRCANDPEVNTILSTLLDDAAFLPEGGTLGFGLRHLYPLPTSFDPYEDDTLKKLQHHLKGGDGAVFRACIELQLSPSLHTIFEADDDPNDSNDVHRALVACPRVVKFHTHDYDEEETVWAKLCKHFGGVLINPHLYPHLGHKAPEPRIRVGDSEGAEIKSRMVHWVTPLSEANSVKTRFAAYGNEPEIGYLYQRICLFVDVGPVGRRGEV